MKSQGIQKRQSMVTRPIRKIILIEGIKTDRLKRGKKFYLDLWTPIRRSRELIQGSSGHEGLGRHILGDYRGCEKNCRLQEIFVVGDSIS